MNNQWAREYKTLKEKSNQYKNKLRKYILQWEALHIIYIQYLFMKVVQIVAIIIATLMIYSQKHGGNIMI